MDDLRDRFRRLDRVTAPDQWNEVVARAAELEAAPRRHVSRTFLLIAAALLILALVGALALGLRLIRPAPDALDIEHTNGMIVGVHECELVGIDPTTDETRVLVPSPPDCFPGERLRVPTALSADGRFLAYVVSRYCGACFEEPSQEALDGQGAWIHDMETGATRQLEPCPERLCEEIDISPDGSLVAYSANGRSGEHALIVVDWDSGRSSRIDLAGMAGRPSFSPDGNSIMLTLDGGAGLYSVDLNVIAELPPSEAPEPVLLYGAAGASNPAWSPDGEWIAFHALTPEYGSGIWVVRSDGTDARLVTAGPRDSGPDHPTWSPDMTRIAYVQMGYQGGLAEGYNLGLWTINIDGGEPSQIYEFGCCIWDWKPPTWSPDGEYIAFGFEVGAPGLESGLAIVRPDGTDLQFISDHALQPDWQPLPIASPAD